MYSYIAKKKCIYIYIHIYMYIYIYADTPAHMYLTHMYLAPVRMCFLCVCALR